MADDLDVVEPKEAAVPEQADMFRQGVTPEPEPEPAPVPAAPEPEPVTVEEPEMPIVEPDWLNAPTPQEMQQQYPPQQPQYQYEQPPPQYPQQPQVPPQPAGVDAALQTFVDNPLGTIGNEVDGRLDARLGPLAYQQQQQANITAMLMNNYVNEGISQADASVRKAYEVFNRDASFRSDKEMQNTIQGTLQGMKQRAEHEARATGNFAPLRALANLDESDMEATLAYMKAKAGRQSPGTGPLQVEGAVVESSRSPIAEQATELPAEFEAVANRLGPHGRERLLREIQVTKDADDFEG